LLNLLGLLECFLDHWRERHAPFSYSLLCEVFLDHTQK